MTIVATVTAGAGADTVINNNNQALAPAGLFGIRMPGTAGLELGYYGGRFNGVDVADGAVTLTASATNYVVAHRTTGVVTAATTTANWLNSATYMQLYELVAGASTFTIASTSDKRQAYGWTAGSGVMSNPMTTAGDIIYGGTPSSGVAPPTRLAATTNGYVLTLASGVPTWAASASGFANPMTTLGDLIVGGASGVAGRYAAGTSGYVLTSNGAGAAPTWQAASGGSSALAWNARTASYTIAIGDANNAVEMAVASANSLTVPPNSTVAFPVGTSILIYQAGAGLTTVVAGSGVTIVKRGSSLALGGQHALATLVKRATNTWILSGDIAP